MLSALVWDEPILHHSSAKALLNSASYCHLCLLIWNEWIKFNAAEVWLPKDIHLSFRKFMFDEDIMLMAMVVMKGKKVDLVRFEAISIDDRPLISCMLVWPLFS